LSVSFIGLVGLNEMLEKRERKRKKEIERKKELQKDSSNFHHQFSRKRKKSFLHFQTLGFFYIRLLVENSLLLFFA
jgi:hypothetical protein